MVSDPASKLSVSPPTYADAVGSSPTAPNVSTPNTPGFTYPVPIQPQQHANFGPTPLTAAQPILPYAYYDSQDIADARARWRFAGAFFWAMAFYCLMGFLIGVEVWGGDMSRHMLSLKRWIDGGVVA